MTFRPLQFLKFCPLCEIYLLSVISINVHCIYHRTDIKTFEDDMRWKIICRLTAARGCKMSHLRCSNHLITIWRGYVCTG